MPWAGCATCIALLIGEFWAWATRGLVSVRDVGFGFPLLFALLIEVVSAIGPAVIIAVAAATRPQHPEQHAAAGPSTLLQAEPVAGQEQVLRWMADRTEPTSDARAVTLVEVFADYAVWCKGQGLLAHNVSEFTTEFDGVRNMPELVGKIRKFGQRYYGLRLVRLRMLAQRGGGVR